MQNQPTSSPSQNSSGQKRSTWVAIAFALAATIAFLSDVFNVYEFIADKLPHNPATIQAEQPPRGVL